MRLVAAFVALCLAGPALAADAPPPVAAPCRHARPLDCATVATPAFSPDGGLWLAWVGESHVWVARSLDRGRTFSIPARVTAAPAAIDDNGENRPKVVVDGKSRVIVAWTVKGAKPYTGLVYVARSEDGGVTFGPPTSPGDEAQPVSMRFAATTLGADDRLYVAWIDKRRSGPAYRGAALAVAWSDDGGATFSPTVIAGDHSCECCRLAMASKRGGLPVLMWRGIFPPNIRDHAAMTFATPDRPGAPVRVADDAWAVDACPHHGPDLALAQDSWHAVWYTQGANRTGAFYARGGDGVAFTVPMPLGDQGGPASHPAVAAAGSRVVLAWKAFDGTTVGIRAMSSPDEGLTWSPPATIATTMGASDHPILVGDGHSIFLSWLTRAEGWRLVPVAVP